MSRARKASSGSESADSEPAEPTEVRGSTGPAPPPNRAQILNVEFEAVAPGEEDFHGIKALLHQVAAMPSLAHNLQEIDVRRGNYSPIIYARWLHAAQPLQLFLQHARVDVSALADLVLAQRDFATVIKACVRCGRRVAEARRLWRTRTARRGRARRRTTTTAKRMR